MQVPHIDGYTPIYDDRTESYIYTVYEFDESKRAWFPRITPDLIQTQQSAYKVDGVDENAIVEKPGLKRKREKQHTKKKKEPKKTAVYVSNLPEDVTEQELEELFQKAGVLLVDPSTNRPRIKLYKDENGTLKGDALVIYLREESVELACQLLDDTRLRPELSRNMTVEPAQFQEKVVEPAPIEKKLKQKVVQELNKKLDWDENSDSEKVVKKAVVLKHMFTKAELDADPTLLLDLKKDVREECGKFGLVTGVVLYDLEEDGVMMVRFKTPEAAEACFKKMNGRAYYPYTIEAYLSTGKEKFKKSKRNDEEEEQKRHEEYGKWLESQATE